MLCTYLFIEPPKGFKGVGVDAAVIVCSLNWWWCRYYCLAHVNCEYQGMKCTCNLSLSL